MARSHRLQRAFVPWAILLVVGAVALAEGGTAQPPTGGDPLKVVPADTLFCVRINKLNTSLGQVDQFLTGISPLGVSMPVRSKMGQILGSPEAAGVDLSGDFVAFGPLPGGEAPDPSRIGVLVPISDYAAFLKNPNVGQPDAQGVSLVGLDKDVAAVKIGGYALVSNATNQPALLQLKTTASAAGTASLGQRLSPDELRRSQSVAAWAYLNVQIVNKLYGPMIQEKIKEAQAAFQKMQAAGQPMSFQPQGVMEMYSSLLNSLMQETQSLSVTLDPSATALRLGLALAALPNTEMAKTLSTEGGQPQPPNLLGYLDNGAVMNGIIALSPAQIKAMMTSYANLLTTLMGAAAPKEDLAPLRQLMTDSADALGGALAWSMSADLKSKPPFEVKYVATLRDRQKFYQVLEQSSKMMSEGGIADFYRKLGIKTRFDLKRNVETYKDVPVDAVHFAIQPVDANKPEAQAMKMMFGEGFDLRLAVVNNLLLYTLAADPQQKIHALIDQAKAGGPTQTASEVQAALDLLPEAKKAEFFITYNLLRMMQIGMAFAPVPMPPMNVTSQSNIVVAGDVGGGRLLISAALPKQHLLELLPVFIQMQQQKAAGQQQMQPQAPPQGQPPHSPGQTQNQQKPRQF